MSFFGIIENLPGKGMCDIAKTLVSVILCFKKGVAKDLILLQAALIFGRRKFQVLKSSSSLDMMWPKYREEVVVGVVDQKGGIVGIGD